jgi:hypothetical protein
MTDEHPQAQLTFATKSAKSSPPNMLSAVDEMPKLAHSESPACRIPRSAGGTATTDRYFWA